jgi:hypothetical protein
MLVAVVAATVVLFVVFRVERRDNPGVTAAGLRGFLSDFRAGWADIRAERFVHKHPDQAPAVSDHLPPDTVDSAIGDVFEWAEPGEPDDAQRWFVRH